jgi:hypothetical protein
MRFEKKHLTDMFRCYSTQYVTVDGEERVLLATEGEGQALSFSGKDYEKMEAVWDAPGGTMSMVPIPGKNGAFLAVQNFFPTFQAEKSIVVTAVPKEDRSWEVTKFLDLPYLHRFDILTGGGKLYFIGCTLCTSKSSKEDWSDPGKIYVGELDLDAPMELKVIAEGLVRNHGYSRVSWKGTECGFVTSDQGVLVVTPPQKDGDDWTVEKLLDEPVSDIAVIDIDGDGEDELVTIEAFHGGNFLIRKKIDGEYKIVFKYHKPMDFGHVVWGGKLRGVPTIIGGYRREAKELFWIQADKDEPLTFRTGTIDEGTGPSNVAVINHEDRDIIIAANREIGEAALYFVYE